MITLRNLVCVMCACLAGYDAPLATAEVAPAQSSGIARAVIGVSEWFSQGETNWSHNASGVDARVGDPSSKLKYKDTGTNVTEISGRVQLKNNVFFRGAFGYGSIGGGRLTDDDFLSAQGAATFGASVSGEHRYSRTYSDIGGDNLWYLSGDIGVTTRTFPENKGTLGLFVGLQYWRERHVATGVTRVECTTSALCEPAGTVSSQGQSAITNTKTWRSGRFGGEVDYKIDKRISVEAKVALLLSYLNNEDVHHLRTDLAQDPSFRMTGLGIGTNSNVNVRIKILDRLYLTGGYQVWWNRVIAGDQWKSYNADGSTVTASLNQFQTLRHGPTIGLTYSF